MKVALLAPALDSRAGGIATVVDALRTSLPRTRAVETQAFAPRPAPFLSRVSGAQARRLASEIEGYDPDLVHTHGLWVAHSRAGNRVAVSRRVPEIVSPHGMLDPWARKNNHWKKWLGWQLHERRHLGRAAAVHALCEPELVAIREMGVRTPVALIPNGIDLPPASPVQGRPPWADVFPSGSKVLLYLGRLHPKKGVRPLVQAWAAAAPTLVPNGWRLALLGWEESGHGAECVALAQRLGVAESCRWFGPAFGSAKESAYAHASAFILPSHSEGLPMTVLEAWAHRRAVFMTRACNLPAGFATGAAVEIEIEPEALARTLEQNLSGSEASARLAAMGEAGRALVSRDYTWERVAAAFAELYRWAQGGGTKPAFVDVV